MARKAGETGAAGGGRRRRCSGGAIMCTRRILGLAVVALLTLGGRARAYTNQWAAHIEGGEVVARQVAEDYGFRYLGKVSAARPFPPTGTGLSFRRCLFLFAVRGFWNRATLADARTNRGGESLCRSSEAIATTISYETIGCPR